MNLGQQLKMNAIKFPNLVALKDSYRSFTYFETNDRINRLANALTRLNLKKGDKVASLMENCIEFVEIYLATAKIGVVIVPVNFRLLPDGVSYIIDNSDAKVVFASHEFLGCLKEARKYMPKISEYILIDNSDEQGYVNYDSLIDGAENHEPDVKVFPSDPWLIIYTSGTTGKPKGVVRSHESHIAFYLINAIDFGFNRDDICMNVMPLCHINSVFFTFVFLYIGALVYIHPAQSFDPVKILKIVEKEKISFISLIPTHYSIILSLSESSRNYDTSSIRKLLCSSAAVRKNMKLAIMDFFPGVELYEGYGSSEAGIVTILKPEDQIQKIGSIGYESLGTDSIKILDESGGEVPLGQVGELYSKGPMLFDCYYKLPEMTANSFQGDWFSAGDMGCKDKDGFYKIVDRKDNMIITGGEHVYPSEVEEVISTHPKVFDVAVIGARDIKWGEKVIAVVIPSDFHKGTQLKDEIMKWCRSSLAGYKRPKDILFMEQEDMPRTSTGKILYRVLRDRFSSKQPISTE